MEDWNSLRSSCKVVIFWTNTFELGIEVVRGEQALGLGHRGSLKRVLVVPLIAETVQRVDFVSALRGVL